MPLLRYIPFFLLLFLNIYIQPVSAQGIIAEYKNLLPPERKWARKHLFIARKAFHITQKVQEICYRISKDSVLKGPDSSGQLDAFRHALWMALLAKQFGEKRAIQIGKVHEESNRLIFEQLLTEDGVMPDSAGREMDLINNLIGASLGARNRYASDEALCKLMIHQIKEGGFYILRTNEAGYFLNCQGEVINMSVYLNQWNIPKCLVPSNQVH